LLFVFLRSNLSSLGFLGESVAEEQIFKYPYINIHSHVNGKTFRSSGHLFGAVTFHSRFALHHATKDLREEAIARTKETGAK
jgi:hypothetical protein